MKTRNFYTGLFIIFYTTVFSQGPWTQGKNKAYVQAGFSAIFYDKIRIDDKNVTLNTNLSDITTQLYSEYGITNNLDISLIVPFKTITAKLKDGSKTESLSGFSNVTIGLKYKIYDHKWKISSGLFFSSNSVTSNETIALRTGYGATIFLPYLSIGLSKNKIYYFANFGYGYMTNQYTDFIKIGGEVGYKFLNKTHIILNIDLKKAMKAEQYFDSTENAQYKTTALYNDKQEFYGIGVKLNHEFINDKFGINIGAIGAFYLNNLPAAPSINTGIYYKM